MVTPARPLASGRDCDVYALTEGRVARTYRDGRSAQAEAELIQGVHALGYPVPRVEEWYDGTIVMERIEGPTLGELLLADRLDVAEAAAQWAELQERLYRLPWPGVAPGESLLHLDFHPFNVIVGAHGPVVIDWSNGRPGPPGLDVAMSALILAGVALAPHEVQEVDGVRGLLAAYAAAVTTAYTGFLDQAAAERLAKPHTTDGERAAMTRAVDLARSVAR